MTLQEIRDAILSLPDQEQMELMMELCPRLMRRMSRSADWRGRMSERCGNTMSDPQMRAMMMAMKDCMAPDASEGKQHD